MAVYDEVLKLLGKKSEDVDETMEAQLGSIISQTENRLKNLLGGAEAVPEALEYITIDVAVRRFNRIGSEGLSSHGVEGETMSWPEDDFAPYDDDIQTWLDAHPDEAESDRGKVRFI